MIKNVHIMINLVIQIQIKDLVVAVTLVDLVALKIFLVRSLVAVEARRRDPNAPRQGADLQYTMTLNFEEAVFGKETEIEIPREETL